MANKNGIIINVGFDSDIKDYVNRIERQLKAVDWNGVLGLSESFNKEYEKITKQLQVLKKEISDLGAPDIHNMNNRLQSITQLTNRLTQQFDALVTSLPTDMQAKMNKSLTSVGNMLTDISEISNQASTAINGFTKAVVNSGVQVKTASSRVAEIQKLLGTIKELNENHKAFDTGEYFNDKSMGDRAKMLDRLYDIYEAYENANKRFSSNKRDLGAVKELQEQFYRFKELYDQILDLDIGDQDSSLTQFWTNVSLLGDKSGAALSDVLAAMKRNYVTIMNTVKKYKANLMAESATFKSDVATAVQTETKEIKKGSNGETIRLVIGVDDSILNKELLDAIAKAQAFAEKNPIHVSVDISTKYRIRKDKENLALLQAEMDSIKEEIENAQYNGASDKAVTALQNKLENAAKTFDKYFKGLDTAYSFHISLHTEYAMKQLSMFISQVKEQINKLKQDKLVFAPEVEIDETFETRLKESTEKVLGKMQDAITKTADALDRLKVYFTEGIEMKPDFMKEERVALGLLWQDLKKVYDQVVLVSEVFKSLAGEKITINNDMQTETLESLKGAMNSISDVIGEETTKKLQIELESTEELKAQLYTLKKEIDKLFETSKMNKWETQYLNAIKNIETAFEGLFGVKESNEMELVSYLAKDIAMTDKAMKKEGRKIGPEDMYDIYNILWDAGVIKEDSLEAFEKAIEKGKLFSSLEHGGYLTKDFKVGGLTSVDSNDSTRFTNVNIDWEKYGAKIVEGILSSIHSHAGDKIWMPSISADLKLASKEYAKNIPYFTTFTGTEVAVIDTEKLAKITANLKDWENLEKLVDKGAYGMAKGDKSVVGQEVYDSYVAERTKYTSKIGRMDYRTSKLIAERVLLDALLKERYGAGLDSFSKIYTLDEYAKARPYGDYHKEEQFTGLSGIITTLQNVVQSATTLTQSLVNYGENQAQTKTVVDPATLTESIINALNTATVNINVNSLAEIIQNAIASSAIKVDTKNGNATSVDLTALTTALTTALAHNSVKFDANELASAIKGSLDFSPVVESINGLPLNAIQDSLQQLIEITQSVIIANQTPSTIQDQIKQLENAIQQDNNLINSLRGNNQIAPSKPYDSSEDEIRAIQEANIRESLKEWKNATVAKLKIFLEDTVALADMSFKDDGVSIAMVQTAQDISNVLQRQITEGLEKHLNINNEVYQNINDKTSEIRAKIDSLVSEDIEETGQAALNYIRELVGALDKFLPLGEFNALKIQTSTLRRPDFFGSDDDFKNANDIQRQIEQLEKDRQQKIERLNYLKSLLQSKTTDTQINLADKFNFDSVDSNKLNELIQFLKTYVNLINKLANDKTMTRVTDNINSLTQAISKFGGSKRKENPVLAQLESLMAKGQELQALADILKKSTAEIQEAVNVVQNTGKGKRNKPLGLGHVEVNSKEWDRLIEKAKKFGITLENVDEIIRHVDDQGNESFRFIDKLGNVKTFGINSKEFKFIEEYVVKVKTSIDTIKREASLLPGIFQKAFRGDANAPTNITNTLEHISTLFAEISKYPDELTGSKSDLLGYISNSMTSAMREVDKLLTGSQKNKSPEFKNNLEAIVESLKEIKTLIDSGEFQEAANLLNGTTQNFFNLGAESGGQSVKNATAINKLLGNIEQLRSTYMSMSHSAKQALQDLSRDIIQTAEQFDNAIPEAKMREFNERFLEIRTNALKSLRTIGSHFKRSALQLARMYLSWYRIISYIRQGVQEVIEMDTALTKMSYTMNVTEEQLKSMSADMISMAKNLATSVNNIEQIYQIYANLKTTQEELEKTARPTAILSNLSSVDASTAADQIQGVLNQFELVADDTMHIVDVYDKISANIKVDYSKGIAGMADAVQQVGNFANQAGLSFEQLAAIVGRVMQQTRQEGGQIGTALKTNKIVSMYRNVHHVNISKTSKT